MTLAFDILLVLLLAASAAAIFFARNLFRAIVAFIIYGTLMGLIWARLAAPDLALAEVALATGITGALLLSTLAEIKQHPENRDISAVRLVRVEHRWLLGALLIVLLVLASVVLSVVSQMEPLMDRLGPWVGERVAETGVSNPVTAVLLDFRSYDTLLEIAVLTIATLSVWSLGKAPAMPRQPVPPVMLERGSALLLPMIILVAGYLLWQGTSGPGGTFQGAAVLAGGIILYFLAHPRAVGRMRPEWLTLTLIMSGCGVFAGIGLLRLAAGSAFLEYPAASAKGYILAIESVGLISITTMLVVLFLAGAPSRNRSDAGGS